MAKLTDPQTRPNVIWILGDQHRAQALSCAGDPNVNTPHVDRMAIEGVRFPQAVGGFPLCCPFRGSMLTSRYPQHCVPGHEYPMPDDMPTIATALNAAGYHTAYFGKWHVDGWKERDGRAAMHIVPPHRRGDFQEWAGYDNNNAPWDSWVHGGEGDGAFHYRLPGYETDCLTDMLVDYIERRTRARQGGDDAPFFAVLSVQPPHNPYVAPEQWMARHNPGQIRFRPNVPDIPRVRDRVAVDLAGYYAQIENLDFNVGRVRQALVDNGLNEETWVMFFSDHGDMHGSQGQYHKTTPFEESIRVPFVITGDSTGYIAPWGEGDVPINHVDIAPTTLGLCNLPVPEHFQGTDYSAWAVRGRQKPEVPDSAYIQAVVPTGHGNSVDRPWRGLVTRDGWKYVCLEHQPWLLFDLNEDPYEQANLAHNTLYRAERKRLNDRLARWIADTDDQFPLPAL